MDGTRARVIAPALAAAALLGLAHSPLRHALPILGTLDGPLGVAVFGLGVATSAARLAPGPGRLERWACSLPGWALDLLLACIFVVAGLRYAERLQASGDEPHYLLMAQSLWQERDLDLRDNYARQDFLAYTPGPLTPHYGAPRKDGRPYPLHSPGLPLLLSPFFAVGGRRGCIIVLAVVAALAAAETRRLAEMATRARAAGVFAWALAAGPPLAFYSFHVYTEAPAAFCLAIALRLLLGPVTVGTGIASAVAASALPFLHVKMTLAAVVLGVLALARARGRSLAAFAAVAAIAGVAFSAYYWSVFGRPTPLAIYGGVPRDAAGSPGIAALGLLFDRSFGLLPYAPAFLLSFAGLAPLLRGDRSIGAACCAAALSVVLPILSWRMWWGGQCPPARFLLPLVPLLGVSAACAAAASRRGLAAWRWPLVAIGCAVAAFAVVRPMDRLLLNRGDQPTRLLAALPAATPLQRYLPSLVNGGAEEMRVAAVWLGVVAALLALNALAAKRDRVARLFSGPVLPLAVFLLGGLLVDYWARAS
jgi:hypothetical protein